ncbi:uncharacterized protein LOC127704231 isoform X2 [Mytilus californianus]|uniref:uncharacterized protein LOC127704231 isoform X2 n=1 Tax=Mytilus californianus TaxID=6549 RepID=UPI0022461213|nr:uncharacterized protein LOC127704231 isoform X2 [Mytilus californianus]
MATDSPCEDKIKRAVKKKDVETILRLCDDISYRTSILNFRKDGRRLVHVAAQFGSVILLEKLCSIGSDLTVLSHDTYEYHNGGLDTTLHIACACGHIEVVKYLLQTVQNVSFKNVATIKDKDKSYRNAFYYAAQSGSVEVVKCLQTLGKLDINEILPHNRTTLSVVVAETDSASAQILCECGANVNLGTFERGLKPIHYIVEKPNSAEIIKVLLNFGANVNEPWEKHSRRSWLRQSPLFMALKHGFADNAKILIEGGANVSFVGQGANLGSISCFSLAAKRCPAIISEFLKHGADPNESLNGQSLFMMAMDDYASSDTIKAFVEAGADVNQNRNGKTLIQSCTCYEQLRPFIEGGVSVKIIESKHKVYTISLALESRYTSDTKSLSDLLSKGADPNLKPEGKDPPLIVATKKNLSEDVECLIKGGAQLDDVSRDGDTAIVVCCKKVSHSCFQTLNILIDSGASLNIASNEGEYPLELLAQRIEKDKHSGANLMRHLFGYQSSHKEEIENCVTKMLAKGANPNITKKGNNSPLIIAVQKQSEDFVQIMLDAGAHILHVGENQRTALDLCFIRGSRSIRDIIVKTFVDNLKGYTTSDTVGPYLVNLLIENGVEDSIVEYAVSRGLNPNRVMLCEDSPLMKAIKRRRYKISCALIEAGADVIYANSDGTNAFDIFSEICKKLQKSQDTNKRHRSKPKRLYPRNTETAEDMDEQMSTDILTNLFRCFMVSGIEVNKPTKYGIYPLQIPIWLNSFEMTKWCLERDADVNIVNDLNNAPLTIALENGQIDIVQLLLDSKANLNFTGHVRSETEIKESKNKDCIDDDIEDSLLTTVIRGNTNTKEVLVKMLLKVGADPNISVKGDDSPLLHAVRSRNIEIIKILLEAGADVNHVGLNSYTALHVYFQHDGNEISSYTQFLKKDRQIRGHSGPSQILQLLLSAGAPTLSLSVSNELPVHFALQLCAQIEEGESEEDIRLLLDYYKDVNIPDNNGNTLLILACAEFTFNIINKIILQGADVNYSGNNGLTAVQAHMDSEIFDKEVVSLLIKNGAEINKINDLGETALIRYIKRGRQHALEKNVLFLIEVGADPKTSVKDCNSALIEALSLNLFNISICLLKANSDVNHVGANGTTALQVILRKVKTTEVKCSEEKDVADREFTFPVTTDVERVKQIRSVVYTFITLLLSAGADVNFVSKDGESPLYILLKLHDTGLVNVILRLFIEKEADPNKGLEVPLILAAELNRQKALKMLLDAGATVDKLNQHGETALITSLRAFSKSLDVKNIGTVKILLESGASFYLKDTRGNIPLSLPFMSGTHALNINPKCDVIIMMMLSTLLEKGACPNKQPDGEDSSLMLAAENCLPECVKLLLKSGAHSDHIGKDGKTALHKCISATGFLPCRTSRYRTTGKHSSRSGTMLEMENFVNLEDKKRTDKNRLKILELLLSHRARVNVDEEGHDSPLLLAIQYEDIEAIKALLKAGSNLFHRGVDRLNAFERCLKSGYSGGLTIFDILLEHQTPEKDSIDSLFHLLWEYVKGRELFRKPLLEGVCVKLLSTDIEITVDLGTSNEDSPLIYFCQLQCLEVVKMLLARKADVNHIGTGGKTVLHTLIDMTNKDASDFQQMVEMIFCAKPNFDIKDECDKSPIEESAYKYHHQYFHNFSDLTNVGVLVQHLLDAGASLPSSDLDKLLKKAAENGDFRTMESVCRHGANKDMTDKNENMILHICWSKTLDGALQFLEYYKAEDGSLIKINKDGNSPLLVLLNEQRDKSEKIETQTANIAAYFMKNTNTKILDKYGNSPLHVAVEAGMVKTVEALLASGAIASKQNLKGRTALHVCLEKPKSNIVEVVSKIMESENPSVELEVSGKTPLYLATNLYERYYMYDYNCTKEMMKQQSRVVEVLIQHGANPNSHNRSNIPLLSAVKAGDIDTVSLLLETGALADVTDEKGQSAIHVLFSEMPHISKDAEMVLLQLLIDNGISVNATDDDGKSALIVAVERYEDRKFRQRFVSRKSNPSFTNNIINELLRHGADVKAVDKRDRTALNIFCQKGSTIEIGRSLLKAGADPSVGNCLQSVLDNRELRENPELFMELLKNGANPNMYSGGGSNLIDATKKGTKPLVEELLRYGADVNFVDYEAKGALHYACACEIETPKERSDIIHSLITHGAKLNQISTEFRRPLDCLIYRMIKDIQELKKLHDEIHSFQYLKIDLSSFNYLVRCGCELAPIEDIDTTYFHDEYRMIPDFPNETSSFLFLIKNGLLTAATFLIRCGWEIEKEEWIDSFDISKLDVSTVQIKYERCNRINMEKAKADFWNFLETFRKSTRSLSMLCINSIRKQMLSASSGSEIETKIEALQVQKKIKSFINLTEFMQDEEIIMLEETERAPPRNRLGFGVMSSMLDSNTFDSATYEYSASTYLYNDDDLSLEDMIDQELM